MSSAYDFDVLYLGAGHGTFDGAGPLAASGKKVGVIESGLIGGTCPNRGCNAKITLDEPVVIQRTVERMQGILHGSVSIDWARLVAHKQEIIRQLPANISKAMTEAGVTIIHGEGHFKNIHTIDVNGTAYTGQKIVVATGLHPNKLDIPGTNLAHDSSAFMDLTTLPKRLAIVGAGYISMEFATMANAVGSAVTVFMHGDKALRAFHQPYVEAVIADLEKRGVTFIRNANVTAFEQVGADVVVDYGNEESQVFDWILDATGRVPNIEHIGLQDVGVQTTKHGIVVNDHLQTSVPNIYAAGDVIDKPQPKLTPTATFESYYLYQLFSGQTTAAIDYPAIPNTVYTSPRIAKVGMTPAQAAQAGDAVKLVSQHVRDDWYRQIDNETMGERLLIFDRTHHLLGATEFSAQAEDSINTLLPAVVFGYDQPAMWRLAHIFPSAGASAWHKIR